MLLTLLLAAGVGSAGRAMRHRIGLAGGFPQMIAATYQLGLGDYVSLEAYAGTLVINSTLGARLIVGRFDQGFSPRGFAGFSLVDQYLAESDSNPIGTSGYLWTGIGAAYGFPFGLSVYIDAAHLGGGDSDKGLGHFSGAALSGGISISL